MDYKLAYECLLEMIDRGMKYEIKRVMQSENFDGCLLSGDHFYLNAFAPFVKKYGYDVVQQIITDLWEKEKADEVSDNEGES